MAAKWQQWMPLDIDEFRGSPSVQAMHPSARSGYLYLLFTQWQTEDCSLSNDPIDLATESGLGDELWAVHGPRIIRKFDVQPDGKIRNLRCFEKWEEAREIFYRNRVTPEELHRKRSEAGRKGNDLRWRDRKLSQVATGEIPNDSQEDRKVSPTGTGTGTLTSTGTGEPLPPATPYDFSADEEANIPDDLPSPVLGNFILQRLSIPHGHGLALKFADCADLIARDEGHQRGEAARLLIHRGRDHPPDNGKWRFWLEDGSWKERVVQGISTEGWE